MTNSDHRVSPRYQTPASIRSETFQRRMRGLDADKVYEYLDLLADQVQDTERELSESRTENERLHAELQRVRAELDEYEQVGDRVNEQVVQLFSQAQLIAEEMVEDVSRDARERIGEARAHERQIVEEAMNTAGEQVRSYARTAQAQMQSIMESFATEVDRLGSSPRPGDSAAAPPHQSDPLFDGPSDQIRFRNGSGRYYPGSD
ncbi:DivIVA domain-containing protein [Nocardioides gansuensis]|nr:DivIVA domain-containing protein [Nocardioides gansuensis]